MQERTFGVIQFQKASHFINIFGHTGQGIPGLYFTGVVGNVFKIFKEKIFYLVKEKELGIPLRKYSITIEFPPKLKDMIGREEYLLDLELPALILFLQLSGNIRIRRLDKCFSSGRVGVDGRISSRTLCPRFLEQVGLKSGHRACYLNFDRLPIGITQLSLRQIHPQLFNSGN